MAYLSSLTDSLEEQAQLAGTTQGGATLNAGADTSGGPTSVAAGGTTGQVAPANNGQNEQKQGAGDFANLRDYLRVNDKASNVMAGNVADSVNTKVNAATAAPESTYNAPSTSTSTSTTYDWNPTPVTYGAPTQSTTPDGMDINGTHVSSADIRNFYAGGGDENTILKQYGVTDDAQKQQLIQQARQINQAPVVNWNGVSSGNQFYTADQVKQFVQQNKDNPEAIAKQAASMGLSQNQIQDILNASGMNVSANDITNYAAGHGYTFNPQGVVQSTTAPAQYNINYSNVAGRTGAGGSNGMENGVLKTAGGQSVTHDEIANFISSNPSDEQVIAMMAKKGMSQEDLATALNNIGILYQNGNPTSTLMNDPKWGSTYNRLSHALYTGQYGYGNTSDPYGGISPIQAGLGHTNVKNADGSETWVPFGTASGQIGRQLPTDRTGILVNGDPSKEVDNATLMQFFKENPITNTTQLAQLYNFGHQMGLSNLGISQARALAKQELGIDTYNLPGGVGDDPNGVKFDALVARSGTGSFHAPVGTPTAVTGAAGTTGTTGVAGSAQGGTPGRTISTTTTNTAGSWDPTASNAKLQLIKDAQDKTKMLETVGGRTELLNQLVNAPGATDRTTQGGLNLDEFIMGGADNNAIPNAAANAKGLQNVYDAIIAELNKEHPLGTAGSTTSTQYIPGTPAATNTNTVGNTATTPTVGSGSSGPSTSTNAPTTTAPVAPTQPTGPILNQPVAYHRMDPLGRTIYYNAAGQVVGGYGSDVGGMGGGNGVGSLGGLGSAIGIGPGNGNIGGVIGMGLGGPIGGMIGNAIGSALGLGDSDGIGIGAGPGQGTGAAMGGTGVGGSNGIGSGTGLGGADADGIGMGGGTGDGFKDGGFVRGPGGPKSDSIDAKLSDGEYVIPAEIVKKYGKDFFDYLLGMNSPGVNRYK